MGASAATDRDAASRAGLGRMKALAAALLVAMALLFTATHLIAGGPVWTGYVRAFAEAAMVGALADWFAVTALFRYPLGIPIPHTAIIPRRKDQLGDSLASFVSENFLVAEALWPRLADTDFASAAGNWIGQRENAARLARDTSAFGAWLLNRLDDASLRSFVADNLHLSLREVQITPLLGRVLDMLMAADRHQELMDTAVRIARDQLDEHRLQIRERIEQQSPWWLPDFVDARIYNQIVGEIEGTLERIGTDPTHPARQRFNVATTEFIERLKSDPDLIARGDALKEELLGHPAVQRYLASLWSRIGEYVRSESQVADSALNAGIEDGLVSLGDALQNHPDMRAQANRWLSDAVLHLVRNYRSGIASVISETVRAWDPDVTATRVELAVGRDLQFIRINGTLVGGLAGLTIHALVELLQ